MGHANGHAPDPGPIFRRLAEIHVATVYRLDQIERLRAEQESDDRERAQLARQAWEAVRRHTAAVETWAYADGRTRNYVLVVDEGDVVTHELLDPDLLRLDGRDRVGVNGEAATYTLP